MTIRAVWIFITALLTLGGMLLAIESASNTSAGGGVTFIPSSRVRVWLDPETGCEYFADSYRPRLGSDGRQICNAEGVVKP